MYFPQEPAIQIHQIRVCPGPVAFPPGYYWYGRKQHSPGPPSWVEDLIESCVPAEPEAELADCMEQPGLEEVETDMLEPNRDDVDLDMWASEFEEVDSRNADLSTTVSPPVLIMDREMQKLSTLYNVEWRPLRGYVAYRG